MEMRIIDKQSQLLKCGVLFVCLLFFFFSPFCSGMNYSVTPDYRITWKPQGYPLFVRKWPPASEQQITSLYEGRLYPFLFSSFYLHLLLWRTAVKGEEGKSMRKKKKRKKKSMDIIGGENVSLLVSLSLFFRSKSHVTFPLYKPIPPSAVKFLP